jgi:hypothetical protein
MIPAGTGFRKMLESDVTLELPQPEEAGAGEPAKAGSETA